ncbi:MAG TPA: DUF262 domain-containing HNH endonuclease family protein [Candidatus Syntrophosphaera sp.]|nr:DUF262 domain-containing HNH endonuclease family protein [Candidatus Syntrophosphaera sp.]
MISRAIHQTVAAFFPVNNKNLHYYVPVYQREYTWKKEKWERFINDIWDNDSGYFVGTVICIPKEDNTQYEVIDGQQRMITLLLMYASIYSIVNDINKYDKKDQYKSDDFETLRSDLKRMLITSKEPPVYRFRPQRQNNNDRDFNAIIDKALYNADVSEIPYAGNRRIFRAYEFFRSAVKRLADEINSSEIQVAVELIEKINNVLMVQIEVLSTSDAFTLFESLNNTGEPLAITDIIKNNLLSKFASNVDDLQTQYNHWRSIMTNLGEDPSLHERFLRHYYNAFRRDLPAIFGGQEFAEKNIGRGKLIGLFEELANRDPKICVQQLLEKSLIYNKLLEPDPREFSSFWNDLIDLDHIGAAPAYQLLMYVLQANLDEDKIRKLVSFLVKFFVRRHLTNTPNFRDLDMLFIDQVESLRSNSNNIDLVIGDLKQKSASEEDFAEKLRGKVYEDNRAACRFILCKIEEEHSTPETKVDLWQRKDGRFRFEIEHIFPQGDNIPQCWVDMIAGGDNNQAEALQHEHVHKLGNLTLTAYNKELRNWSFEKKRDHMVDEKITGYRNGLHLNIDLADEPTWTVEKIEKRTNTLVEKALSLFRFTE